MITRREFVTAATALTALGASGIGGMGRLLAQGKLSEAELLAFQPLGNVTLVHVTDIHAQLVPMLFREPSINIGVGDAKGKVPHIVGDDYLKMFGLASGSAEAHALTYLDFEKLAVQYGRMGGLDRIATIIKGIRADRAANTLLLDGGDTWTNSWTSYKTQGADMVGAMNLLKPDAMTGHWEFTLGEGRVKEIVDGLAFPFLAQNVRDNEFEDKVFEPYKMFERGGVKIAVIGQAFPFTPIANPRWMIPKWSFGIREQEMQKAVDEVRAAGADLIVVLSHNGFDVDRKLVASVTGIDIILTGHTHDAVPQVTKVGKTLMVASGSHGKFVSRIDLDVQGKEVKAFRYRLIPVFADAIKPDAEMAAYVTKAREPYKGELSKELARTESLLFRRGNFNGTLDDIICDAILAERDAEIALSPGIRWGTSILPGSAITFEDVTNGTAMSYPNCYRMTMSGKMLKDILEDVADNIFNPDPFYQQGGDMVRTGGLGYTIDIAKPIGSRITDMTILKTGKQIEAAKDYVVSGWASINQGTQGPPIWDVVSNYLTRVKTVKVDKADAVKVVGA